MNIIYEDENLICDNFGITIKWYFFPFGEKKIPYNSIRNVAERSMELFSGQGRIWGMDLSPEWFHLDPKRPFKDKCIVIDIGEWIKPTITPENHNRVWQILQEQVN